MKIWSGAIKDADGNDLTGMDDGFTLQGAEYAGALYKEDEDNFYSVVRQPSSAYLSSYYVEDENNVGSVRLRGTAHSSTTHYKGNGGYITGRGSSVTVTKQGAKYNGTLYYKSGDTYYPLSSTMYWAGSSETYYTGNGSSGYLRGTSVQAIEYDGTLYEDGGVHTYPLYTKVSKSLYEKGTTVTYPAYKKYSGKLYGAGKAATIVPAKVTTQDITALTA